MVARTLITQPILDTHIEQITITRTKDNEGNPQIRIRSNVIVTLQDSLDPARTSTTTININKTMQELGVGSQVNAIKSALLSVFQQMIV